MIRKVKPPAASGAFDEPDDPDAELVFGLERVLDGIDVLVRNRA